MTRRAARTLATATPSHVALVIMSSSYHAATTSARPHDIIPLHISVLDVSNVDVINMK